MTPLQSILAAYRATSQTEREKGTYFEDLIRTYPRTVMVSVGHRACCNAEDHLVLFLSRSLKLHSQIPNEGHLVSALALRGDPASGRARQGHPFASNSDSR